MRADFSSGKVPTTRVRRLISLFLPVEPFDGVVRADAPPMLAGISQYASVSAKPSRTTFAASFSLIDSSSAATDSALAAEVNLNLNLSQSSPPGPLLVQDFHRSPNRLSY